MEDLVGGGEPPRLVVRELKQEVAKLLAISADEPNTFVEVERNPCWLKAMPEEVTSITKNMSSGHQAIELKWVFKVKRNKEGKVVKHKSRMATSRTKE